MAFNVDAEITDKDFFHALDLYLITLTKEAHPYTSKTAILERLLYKCSTILSIDLNWHQGKHIIQIHPDNMLKIDDIWPKLNKQEIKLTYDEENLYKIFKNSDFIHVFYIQKIITLLINKHEKDFLNELLAVDGFHSNYKKCIENLKIGNEGNTHIHVIRKMYKMFEGYTTKLLYLTLLRTFIQFAKDDEVHCLISNIIRELEKDLNENEKKFLSLNMEKMINFYMNNVENIESIAMLKMAQLKIKNKKVKKIKCNKD